MSVVVGVNRCQFVDVGCSAGIGITNVSCCWCQLVSVCRCQLLLVSADGGGVDNSWGGVGGLLVGDQKRFWLLCDRWSPKESCRCVGVSLVAGVLVVKDQWESVMEANRSCCSKKYNKNKGLMVCRRFRKKKRRKQEKLLRCPSFVVRKKSVSVGRVCR